MVVDNKDFALIYRTTQYLVGPLMNRNPIRPALNMQQLLRLLGQSERLNLYRIDLSEVVSKYTDETEKNLRRLLDAAKNHDAILLFDEADALFGKRSEVRDSHDRYANIDINYLLEQLADANVPVLLAFNCGGKTRKARRRITKKRGPTSRSSGRLRRR